MKFLPNDQARYRGFTLVELMVTLAVLTIVLGVAAPSFSGYTDSRTLARAAERVYGHLQRARSESLARSRTVGVNFSVDGSEAWTYGFASTGDSLPIANNAGCNTAQTSATAAGACVIVVNDGDATIHGVDGAEDTDDLVLKRFTNTDATDGITMNIANFDRGDNLITFEPQRGTAEGGDITLVSAGGRRLTIQVGALGQITICSPDDSVGGYRSECN